MQWLAVCRKCSFHLSNSKRKSVVALQYQLFVVYTESRADSVCVIQRKMFDKKKFNYDTNNAFSSYVIEYDPFVCVFFFSLKRIFIRSTSYSFQSIGYPLCDIINFACQKIYLSLSPSQTQTLWISCDFFEVAQSHRIIMLIDRCNNNNKKRTWSLSHCIAIRWQMK